VLFRQSQSHIRATVLFGVGAKIEAAMAQNVGKDHSFEQKQKIFHDGLTRWQKLQVGLAAGVRGTNTDSSTEMFGASGCIGRLGKIAAFHREWNIPDAAAWARSRVEEFFQITSFRTDIESWFKFVCEGRPDFDKFESGFQEQWRAPAWISQMLYPSVRQWILKGRPDYLTLRQTVRELRSTERKFIFQLKAALDKAEHRVRLEVGSPTLELQRSSGRKHTGRPPSSNKRERQKTIRNVSSRDVVGKDYCAVLDAEGVSTKKSWQRDGCPKTYLKAYEHPDPAKRKRWRALITDEKYKATRSTR
jgi:hypothetical protein